MGKKKDDTKSSGEKAYKFLLTEKLPNGVAIATLNRPEENNVLHYPLFLEITDLMETMSVDDDVRVVIFRAAGDHFCMGGDMRHIVKNQGIETSRFFSGLERMYMAIKHCRKITIAAVHGTCTAGGFGVSMSNDMVVASEDAKFGTTAVKVGMYCATSGVMLPPIIGAKRAFMLGFTGELISAAEAERWGFINKVVPREKLMETAMQLAETMLAYSPLGLDVGKKAFLMTRDMEYGKALHFSIRQIAYLIDTKDGKEAMKAFLEKRKPVWSDEWRKRGGDISPSR